MIYAKNIKERSLPMLLLTLTNPAGVYILLPCNKIDAYMHTFYIDFDINP